MTINEINQIAKKASEIKDLANSKYELYILYPIAKELYIVAHDKILVLEEVQKNQKEFLSTIYKYESLDCEYSFKLKEKKFSKCKAIAIEQRKLIQKIFDNYKEEDIIEENIQSWYNYLKNHFINTELKEYFPIGKSLFEDKQFLDAIYYFRRSEEVMNKMNIVNFSDDYKKNFNLNYAILKFNISQCQIGILNTGIKNTEFLERQIIKGLLESLELNKVVISESSDSFYEKGNQQIIGLIKKLLESSLNSWQTIYDYTLSEQLWSFMIEVDLLKANRIIKDSKSNEIKVDYLLFYTHGFNTRGEWKNDLTQVISTLQSKTNINFVLIPWDYGTFIIQFFISWSRKRAIKKFENKYQEILDIYGYCEKKCLIAHSFGTYITGSAIQQNENFVCDRIIFAGNILDVNYDWKNLNDRSQVGQVLVEKSTNDYAVLFAWFLRKIFFQRWIGYAGRSGFTNNYPFVTVIESKSGHSGMLNKKNMTDNWFNFLIN